METVTSLRSNIYWTEATVASDGSLILTTSPDLPLKPGEKVTVILSPLPEISQDISYPLQGTVVHYEDPFGPATAWEDREALRMSTEALSLMTVYSGWGGYQQSLVSAITPLSREHLLYRPAPDRRSVGEIAGHIAFGRVDWFQHMGAPGSAQLAEQIAPLRQSNGQVVEAVTESSQEIVRWLETSWQMVENVLTHWTVEDLARTYRHVYWGKTYAISYQWTIWRIMAHDIHHGGQLTTLLAAQGIELPELGDNGGHIVEVPLVEV